MEGMKPVKGSYFVEKKASRYLAQSPLSTRSFSSDAECFYDPLHFSGVLTGRSTKTCVDGLTADGVIIALVAATKAENTSKPGLIRPWQGQSKASQTSSPEAAPLTLSNEALTRVNSILVAQNL